MDTKLFRIAVVVGSIVAGNAIAHGEDHHGDSHGGHSMAEETAFGRAADPGAARRTIVVEMRDSLEFAPSEIYVRTGEIVRFIVVNAGKHTHEMVLGTMRELEEHSEMMQKNPSMHHDEPQMAHVPPGKSGAITWQFTEPGDFYFGCLVEDHFELGMMGKIHVSDEHRSN